MNIKTLLGEWIAVLPDDSDQKTPSGIIIPENVISNNSLKSGVIVKKGKGTPWNRMDDIHVKERIYFKKRSGIIHEEKDDAGRLIKYLLLRYSEIYFV